MPQKPPDELWKWIHALSKGELRQVKTLMQARARGQDTQPMALLEWLCQAPEGSAVPADAAFAANFPTNAARLKDAVLDALALLHRDADLDSQLLRWQQEIALLGAKQLHPSALRLLKIAKKAATAHCRHAALLQLLMAERSILLAAPPPDLALRLQALQAAETAAIERLVKQQALRHRHDTLWAQFRQVSVPRSAAAIAEIQALADAATIADLSAGGGYLEQALAVNTLGIRDLSERRPEAAMHRYKALILQWRDHPDWIKDQTLLFYRICNYFQIACYTSNIDVETAQAYGRLVPEFGSQDPAVGRNYEFTLRQNGFTLALNLGKLDLVAELLPTFEQWLAEQATWLSDSKLLSAWRNLAVARLLMGDFKAANRNVLDILNHPNRTQRSDIRDNARVMQAVIQYELGERRWTEYLARSTRRYFQVKDQMLAFELVVARHLEKLTACVDVQAETATFAEFARQLDALEAQVQGTVPLFGLMEIRLWVDHKRLGRPIRDLFLEAVAANLAALRG